MAQFNSPWEGLLAGLGSGLPQGANRAFQDQAERRKRKAEMDQMDMLFRQKNAMESVEGTSGTPQQKADATDFLFRPLKEQSDVLEHLSTFSPSKPSPGYDPMAFTPQPVRGAMAAQSLKPKPRASARSGVPPSLLTAYNAALASLKKKSDKPGIEGRMEGVKGIGLESGPAIAAMIEADMVRKGAGRLTPDDMRAINAMLSEEVGAVAGQ